MELTREHFRSMIFYNFRHGLSRQECIDELKSLFAPSYSTVKNWFNECNWGRRLLKDEVRETRPKIAVVSEHIDAVRELIMQDRHVTNREIKASLGISSNSVHTTWTPGRKKNLFQLDTVQFDKHSKKDLYRLVQRNVGKMRWQCLKRRLWDRHR